MLFASLSSSVSVLYVFILVAPPPHPSKGQAIFAGYMMAFANLSIWKGENFAG
jgi:hypothetical protein